MSTDRIYKERVLAVLVYLQQHLDEEVSLDELARVAHFSPFHFHRIFRGVVGECVMEHIRRLRLERAVLRLKGSNLPVLNLALEAGYETHKAFTRAFGAMFGCAPSEYRRSRQTPTFAKTSSSVHWCADQELDDFEPLDSGETRMDVRIEKMPAMRVAFARGIGPYHQTAPATWQRLCGWAGSRGLLGPNTLFMGICHDDPDVTPPEKIRYDAAIPVGNDVQPEGDIGVQELPAGSYAMTTHVGPYEKLGSTWGELCGQWLPHSGYVLHNAPSFEIYRNDPQRTPPDQLRTDLYLPVEPRQ